MLTFPKLVLRNLAYHWRGNLAVLLGVVVGSAVLTGALLVGDSLRGSLRVRAERQLNGIDAAAMFPRLLRAEIADGMPGKVAPVLLLPGTVQAVSTEGNAAPFLGRVTVLGVDTRFEPGVPSVDWGGTPKQVVLSDRVAAKLRVKVGDRVRLGVEKLTDIPRATAFAKRGVADVTSTEELTVAAVLPPEAAANDFNLTPNPAAPLNVFVPIRTLSRLVTGDSDPKANTLLASGATTEELNASLKQKVTPDDLGFRFREIDQRGYVSIEYDQLVFPPDMLPTIDAATKSLGLRSEQTVVYVADTLAHGTKEIPYPVIAGLNPAAAAPLGPFLPKGVDSLADGEVVLLQWTGSELKDLPLGSKLRLSC
ncbi:MAG: ABC transporter permease [Gemmataceae bacterium]